MARNLKIDEFIDAFTKSLQDGSFVKASLGHYTGTEADLKNILVRGAIVKREEVIALTYRYKTKDIAKNFPVPEGILLISEYLENDFRAANLYTTVFDMILQDGRIRKSPPTNTDKADLSHDKAKQRMISTDGKHYLHALKITDGDGKIYKAAQDKFKQINKYIEILDGLIKTIPGDKRFNIVDMGSGKGYLTFALYDHITNNLKRACTVTGVEYRQDMVDLCNDIARASAFEGLSFQQETIDNFKADKIDILIALHACDTATDDAIAKGIKAGADLIVVAPCCHKQIRRAMEIGKPSPDLNFMIQHGTLMERQAEMATDAMRALILESEGYNTKAFEFISDTHTPKNVMITAVKGKKAAAQKDMALRQFEDAKKFLGIETHYLEGALRR